MKRSEEEEEERRSGGRREESGRGENGRKGKRKKERMKLKNLKDKSNFNIHKRLIISEMKDTKERNLKEYKLRSVNRLSLQESAYNIKKKKEKGMW